MAQRHATPAPRRPALHNPFITPNELRRIIHLSRFPVARSVNAIDPDIPIRRGVVVASKSYLTRDEAAADAESQALGLTAAELRRGKALEYGGWILRTKTGRFTFTVPITFGADSHFYPLNEVIPSGYRGAADYHTHPHVSRYERQGFSDMTGDAGFHTNQNFVGYVADTYSWNMYRFVPGKTKDSSQQGPIGDLIVHLP